MDRLEDTILITGISVPTILAIWVAQSSSRAGRRIGFPGLPGPITNIQQTAINQGDTSVSGIDFNVMAIAKTDYGLFNVNLMRRTTPSTTSRCLTARSSKRQVPWPLDTPTAGPIPKWKTYLTLNWQYGRGEPRSRIAIKRAIEIPMATRQRMFRVTRCCSRTVSSYTWDLQGSWSGYQGLTAIVGVRNLFDKKPPYTNAASSTRQFQAGYATFRTSTCMISSCTHGLCTTSNRSVQADLMSG